MAERINEEGLEALGRRASEGPVVMLNLLEFLPDGGAERYAKYGEAVGPLLEKAGGRPLYAGSPDAALVGEGSWDLVILVEYPTRQAFMEMVSSAEYQAIAHLRTEALARSELRPMDRVSLEG